MARGVSDGFPHTVFVVDDDAAVAKAIARLLSADGWKVKTFASAEAFLDARDRGAPGCLVLDVNLPGLDGLALQQQLRDAGAALPIVFLTGHGDIPMSVRAIKAGAADFLTKPVRSETLNAAIRAAIEQHAEQSRNTADIESLRKRLASLTPREREVLDAVVAGRLNKQIAFDLGIVEQTVKYHRARIMERMQVKSVAELMHIVARSRGN
jgi:FixJ family two-component response regulator